MAHKFIKKDGKYYRINSDNTQTEVQLKDGYFHWTQPDKVKVRVKLDNNLTDMDKSESLLNKIGRMFTNATIGAANADSPAVMTASGWSRNKDGSWSYTTDSEGAQELRRNLAVLSGTAYIPTAMATAPLIAPGTTGDAVIGNAAGSMAIGTALEEGQRAITGQSAGDIISSRLQQAGVPSILADAARPEYYINPTGAAKATWNAGSKAVQKGTQYASKVKGRYNTAHTPLASEYEVERFIKSTMENDVSGLPTTYYRTKGLRTSDFRENPLDEFSGFIEGGLLVKPGTTVEMHINPTLGGYFDIARDGSFVIENSMPPKYGNLQAGKFLKQVPRGTVITSNAEARNLPQLFRTWTPSQKLWYYATGRTPQIESRVVDHGYSTDIVEQFRTLNKKGQAYVTPSLTTRLPGLNIYGKGFEKYKSYFDTPDADGNIFFKDMTEEQVEAWNREVAPQIGHYIDPITRTSEQLTLITQ